MPPKNKRSRRIEAWVRRHEGKYECACGCGQDIEIKKSHYRTGIPNFIKGHNLVSHNPRQGKEAPSQETTWDLLDEAEKERRLSQLRPFPSGEEHPNWNGGETITESGYKLIRCPDHPYANGGYVAEHRLLVEEWLSGNDNNKEVSKFVDVIKGKPHIKRECVVHHIDEDKLNNTMQNFILMSGQSTHLAWHMKSMPDSVKLDFFSRDIYCPWLNKTY